MDEETTALKLLEPKSPEALVPDAWLQPWMIGVIFVLVGVALALWIAKKRRDTPVDPLQMRNMAFQEALASLGAIHLERARDTAVQASLILRKYLAQAASDPALYETHEEFIARHSSLAALSDEAKSAAAAGFAHLATMKYAREIPSNPPEEIVTSSRELLETIHHGFSA